MVKRTGVITVTHGGFSGRIPQSRLLPVFFDLRFVLGERYIYVIIN